MGYAFCGVVEYAVDLVGTKNLRVVEYDINDILHRTRTRHIPGHGFESHLFFFNFLVFFFF